MKKTVLIALLLTFAVGSAMAQNSHGGNGYGNGTGTGTPANTMNGGNQGGPGNPVDRLTEILGLDETQVALISAIFDEAQALREEEREQARLAACDIRASIHEQVLAELSLDQIALYEEHLAQREQLRQAFEEFNQARGGSGYGGGRGMMDCDS